MKNPSQTGRQKLDQLLLIHFTPMRTRHNDDKLLSEASPTNNHSGRSRAGPSQSVDETCHLNDLGGVGCIVKAIGSIGNTTASCSWMAAPALGWHQPDEEMAIISLLGA